MPFRPGFDPHWRSEEDYVLGITSRIWEERRLASLHAHYAGGLVVRAPAAVVVGNAGIVAATAATLAEFPDRELPGEDVIWQADGPDAFVSSHRLICTATHGAEGAYGPPTGRRVTYRILAECWCRGDAVHDEWLVRDQGAIVRQMGWAPEDWTRLQIAREGGPEHCLRPFSPARDVAGPYRGAGARGAQAEALADALARVWADGDARGWDPAAEGHRPSHVAARGRAAVAAFWRGLRAAVPDGTLTVHHAMGRADPGLAPRAALRWSVDGRHEGPGPFSAPTGAPLHVMGITHAEIGPRGLRREWTLIDETAIWRQIVLATG